jgi:DNA-binding XRE family transcriptional regulator
MKKKNYELIRYNDVEDFGKSLGLSDLDIELIRHKKELIQKLIEKRKKLGLSQAEVAARIDSKQPTIARMEAGLVGKVSLDFLAKVAIMLGVSFSIKGSTKAA